MDKLEEVKKLKKLLDDGIIEENDFAKKKSELLGIAKKEEVKVEEETPKKETKTKNKSLDDYEKELIEQTEKEIENETKSSTKNNDDFYQQEKLKARAKLDAEEEIRKQRKAEQREVVNKGVNKTKRIFKWILAVILWLFAIGSLFTSAESGLVYIPIGIITIVLGCMACPKITNITKKYEAYTMHKAVIVWILVIVMFALMIIFPTNSSEENNNNANTISENQ